MSPAKDDAPKIAVKGFSLSSKPKSSSSKPAPKTSLGKHPRSTFTTHDSDSDSDSDHDRRGRREEAITGFVGGRALREDEPKPKAPLVIPRLENKWKSAKVVAAEKKGKNLLPPEVQAQQAALERERNGEGGEREKEEEKEVVWGLNVPSSRKDEGEQSKSKDKGKAVEEKPVVEVQEMTADEEALARLLGDDTAKKGPALVIPAAPLSEEDAYKRAAAEAPDTATLDDYERIPVEDFGAALLRGMGWNGEMGGTKVKDVKRRQNLLGLGAKELKDAEELGAWVQKSDVKRLKPGAGGGERRPKVADYKREQDERRAKRESYRDDTSRGGRDGHRDERRDDKRNRDRDDRRDKYGERERERDRDRRTTR